MPEAGSAASGHSNLTRSTPSRQETIDSRCPPFVAGKWKAVRIAVVDKNSVSQKIYTIPIGGMTNIPSTSMNIKVEAFLPAFIMEGSNLTSSSNEPTNPGVKIQITEKGAVLFSGWLFSKFPSTHAFMHPRYGFTLVDAVPSGK